MQNVFYIISNEEKTWFKLLIRKTHFCISCGEKLDRIITVLKRYVKKYKTEQKLMKVLSELEGGGIVQPKQFEYMEQVYLISGKIYEDLVYNTVQEALKENREEVKKNNPFNRIKKALISSPATPINTPEIKPAILKPVVSPLKKILPRRPALLTK